MEFSVKNGGYSVAGADFDLHVVAPADQEGERPAIFVAHAWDGLNEPIKDCARRVAELGYVAVAVDVYGRGVRGDPLGDNAHLMGPLIEDRGLLARRLTAGYAAMQELEEVDRARIGAIGYCFGGLCILDLARAAPEGLKGAVSFHGGLAGSGLSYAAPMKARVLIEHGWADPMVPSDEVLAFTREMDARGADWQLHIHGGAMHAFTFAGANMPERGLQYHEAAARRSWRSMVAFFEEVL